MDELFAIVPDTIFSLCKLGYCDVLCRAFLPLIDSLRRVKRATSAGTNSTMSTSFDFVIYGSTSGAVTAAIQSAKLGRSIALISPEEHIGRQTPIISTQTVDLQVSYLCFEQVVSRSKVSAVQTLIIKRKYSTAKPLEVSRWSFIGG